MNEMSSRQLSSAASLHATLGGINAEYITAI